MNCSLGFHFEGKFLCNLLLNFSSENIFYSIRLKLNDIYCCQLHINQIHFKIKSDIYRGIFLLLRSFFKKKKWLLDNWCRYNVAAISVTIWTRLLELQIS